MNRFHVNASWRTRSGTLAHLAQTIVAQDELQAETIAARTIRRDRRHRYASDMQARAIMLPEGEE